VELLVNNYKPGDFQLIEARLREPVKIDDLHSLEIGVRNLAYTKTDHVRYAVAESWRS